MYGFLGVLVDFARKRSNALRDLFGNRIDQPTCIGGSSVGTHSDEPNAIAEAFHPHSDSLVSFIVSAVRMMWRIVPALDGHCFSSSSSAFLQDPPPLISPFAYSETNSCELYFAKAQTTQKPSFFVVPRPSGGHTDTDHEKNFSEHIFLYIKTIFFYPMAPVR